MKKKIWIISILSAVFLATPALALSGTIVLPKTGQTSCYDSSGNPTACPNTGQDGDTLNGASWPSPRFKDNGDGTITDFLTGKMFLKDGACFGFQKWEAALATVADFNSNPGPYNCEEYTATYDDWYLPNIVEIESLVNAEQADSSAWLNNQGFKDMGGFPYWSSTTDPLFPDEAKIVDLSIGDVYRMAKDNSHTWIPVRNGPNSTPDPQYPANLWKTGQTTCYDATGPTPCPGTGVDGDTLMGIDWPVPRFADNGDTTVTDNLTGNIWFQDANCMETKYPFFDTDGVAGDGEVTWDHALEFVNGINSGLYPRCGAGKDDWRLGNRKDFFSLVDSQESDPVLPSGHPFTNVPQSVYYWTSTTRANSPQNAFRFSIEEGFMDADNKTTDLNYVWYVRGGGPEYYTYLPIVFK